MNTIKTFNPKKSIRRAKRRSAAFPKWRISVGSGSYSWSTGMDRIEIIRNRVSFESIEWISDKAFLPVKDVLILLDMPQTTYNKKKRDKELLSARDSEIILFLSEILDYGKSVFNDENEKFIRWLKNSNTSLGGVTPESLFDSVSGILEVRNALDRLEYGNLA